MVLVPQSSQFLQANNILPIMCVRVIEFCFVFVFFKFFFFFFYLPFKNVINS